MWSQPFSVSNVLFELLDNTMRWARIRWICAIATAFTGACADILDGRVSLETPTRNDNKTGELHSEVFEQYRLESHVVESPVIVAHPKITEPPNFSRRKLGSIKWDMVHDGIQGRKRELASCPTDYQMCPESMKGGCCPNDRVCGTSSCYTTSAAPASACGVAGYIACGIDDGGEFL